MTLVVLEIEQKRPVNNSSQNGRRDPQFYMKIDLALLIPTIYITPFVQKWHLEKNGSQATKCTLHARLSHNGPKNCCNLKGFFCINVSFQN